MNKLKNLLHLIVCDERLRKLVKNTRLTRDSKCGKDAYLVGLKVDVRKKNKMEEIKET